MITLFQIDKSGSDIFDKNYSIVLIVDKKKVYGINIPSKIKDELSYRFKQGDLNIEGKSFKTAKNRFRLRLHTSIVIKLVEKAIKDLGKIEEVNIQVFNDFDGHFHEIKDMIYKNLKKQIKSLNEDDILQVKFPKPSLIDESGKALRETNKNKIKDFNIIKLDLEELIKLVRK